MSVWAFLARRGGLRAAAAAAAILAGLALPGLGAHADESAPAAQPAASPAPPSDDGIFKTIAKKLGLATDVGPPADFVVKERPKKPADYVPLGRRAWVRSGKVETPDDLKALDKDFDAVRTRADALRAGFPPAMKAVAEQQAAEKAKKKSPAAGSQ